MKRDGWVEFVQVDLRTNLDSSLALGDRLRAAAGASAFYGERLRDFVLGLGCFPCFPDFCISLYILWKKGCGGYFVFMAGYGTIVARGFI